MKIVFLDFDGVLNSTAYTLTLDHEKYKNMSTEWWAYGLDDKAVARLNTLVDRTGAKVVISSSWRMGFPTVALQRMLDIRGFNSVLYGQTPYSAGVERWEEIEVWLKGHPEVTSYVILDDDSDANIEGHFVQTDVQVGLTDADVERAVQILENSGGEDGKGN